MGQIPDIPFQFSAPCLLPGRCKMRRTQKYQKIESELDKIIIAEINIRFTGKQKAKNPWKIKEIIEKKNREIVKSHQRGKIASNLSMLFSASLQIKEGGKLYFGQYDLNKKDFESYVGKKNRFEALLGASLNTLGEEDLINIVYRKRKIFDDEYDRAKEIITLVKQALEIRDTAETPDLMIPKDEASAISYLGEIAPLKAAVQKIESRYIELREDIYIEEMLKQLQSAINLTLKSITLQGQKASRFLFDQARAVFQSHKSAKTGISAVEEFIRQKEELVRYHSLFDSIGDENRKKQTGAFISTIEAAIVNLQKDAAKQKKREADVSGKNTQDVKEAYEHFLEIKKMYSQGKLDTTHKRKNAISGIKKSQTILKSNGQRVKAREIERFLNSTGIGKKEETVLPDAPQEQNLFYKRAFLAILPITIMLALLNAYHLLSGCKPKQNRKIAPVAEHTEKEKKPESRKRGTVEASVSEKKTEAAEAPQPAMQNP